MNDFPFFWHLQRLEVRLQRREISRQRGMTSPSFQATVSKRQHGRAMSSESIPRRPRVKASSSWSDYWRSALKNPGGYYCQRPMRPPGCTSKMLRLLERHFRLHLPSVACLRRILDKKLFSDAAASAGLGVLPIWTPHTVDEAVELAPGLPYPLLIKPRTHVHKFRNNKGIVVSSSAELISQYRQFVNHEKVGSDINPVLSQINLPILQKFVPTGKEGVYSVTGFVDRTEELFVTRTAAKVFQRSQPVGVGVCFESRPPVLAMSDAVRRLCHKLGYFGMFEVEFVRFEDRWAAIDFNPRLFNQLGMDIRRCMPLPLFACLEAAGDMVALREAVAKAQAERDDQTVFCDRFTLNAMLLVRP